MRTNVEEGLSKRGERARQKKEKQGPLTPQCLADNICKLKEEELERLFNQMVQVVVGHGLVRGKLLVALDGSKLPTPKSYEGCGKVKQTRKVKVKGQKEAARRRVLPLWVENPGVDRSADASALGHESRAHPRL